MSTTEHANDERHYILLTIAIIIGIIGVYLRFVGDAAYFTWAANIILITAAAIMFKAVFTILE